MSQFLIEFIKFHKLLNIFTNSDTVLFLIHKIRYKRIKIIHFSCKLIGERETEISQLRGCKTKNENTYYSYLYISLESQRDSLKYV